MLSLAALKEGGKNVVKRKQLLNLNIAGVGCSIVLSEKYGPEFMEILKKRYSAFSGKETSAKTSLVYKGLPNKYAFDTFVRLAYSSLLLKHNGFLLHASGVVSRGKGYIFTGISGAGKTTIAEVSKRRGVVLSDEIVAVRKTGKSWKLFGTPFMGLMKGGGKNKAIKNPKLLFLRQASKNALKTITIEKAWEKLLRNVILFKPEKKIAGLSYDFISSVENKILEFKKTGFWRVLWAIR
ncbi:MAG: hypothetical protein V1752_05325 [Candidatus Firestonebacteria bacterium]